MIKAAYELLKQKIDNVDMPYLYYDNTPDGHGQSLILLHATGFPPQLWHPVAMQLSEVYRVIVPFYTDHREPDADSGTISWMSLAKDFEEFCRGLNMKRPLVVGHSMGANIAVISEAVCGLKPAALILIEPIFLIPELYGIPFTVEDHPFASKSIKRIDHWRDEEELSGYLKSRPLFKRWDHNVLELYIRYGYKSTPDEGIHLICSPQREAILFMGGMSYNPWPLFPGIESPVLVLEGEESENQNYVQLKKASSQMPQGSYRQLKEAGHLIPMEKPRETANIILDYLGNLIKK
ncbi:MAG: alpha/beta hydrolase [Deltaproteobacteria bacterium]|nr:alpha/beta hydrolase [Deltaproteobacteria bacterium]